MISGNLGLLLHLLIVGLAQCFTREAFHVRLRHHQTLDRYQLAQSTSRLLHNPRQAKSFKNIVVRHASSQEKNEESSKGMEAAFRELENLDSLGDDNKRLENNPTGNIGAPDEASKAILENAGAVEPEEAIRVMKDLVEELESDDDALYTDVLSEMGMPNLSANKDGVSTASKQEAVEDFIGEAIKETLGEGKSLTPEQLKSASDSLLDDAEIMKEIETIFDEGNKKLLDALEEIRQEQRDLAAASANRNAKQAMESSNNDEERMVQAQASMEVMLEKVNKDTEEVEKALADLQKAQDGLDSGALASLASLKKGGIVKQGAFVGLLLFSVRAVGDVVMSGGADSEAHITAAIVQGGIALVCGAILLLL